jgi:SnoaL-like domain
MTDLGPRFVAALAAKDTDRLIALFAPDVDFRAMTPGRFWEADSPQRVVREVLYEWFEPDDVIERVDHVEAGHVADRERVDYRFLVRNPDGPFLVEQRAYFDVDDDGRIILMRALCSGYPSVAGQ